MKITEERLIETVIDRVCDVCGSSVMIDVGGHKYEECGELKANWGYGSKNDGDSYQLDLCERCFQVALLALRDEYRSVVMFDDDRELPDDKFGLSSK
jgi:hypothetical protein